MRRRLLHELQTVQTFGQRLGHLGVAGQKYPAVRLLARFEGGQVIVQRLDHARIILPHGRGRMRIASRRSKIDRTRIFHARSSIFQLRSSFFLSLVHDEAPNESLNWAKARAQSFFTLSTVRPIRKATWGKLSPSK